MEPKKLKFDTHHDLFENKMSDLLDHNLEKDKVLQFTSVGYSQR